MTRNKILVLMGVAMITVSGAAHAMNDDRQTVTDVRGGVVRNTFGNCVRTKWMAAGDPCAPAETTVKQVTVVQPPPPPPPPVKHTIVEQAARTVYFPFNKTDLTDQAKAQLDTLAETLKHADDIQEAKVVGTADRIGGVSYNDQLSKKRAEKVRDYLIARGYTHASVTETRWVGKSQPTTNCPKKMPHKKLVECLQNDRRVSIDIVYRSDVYVPAAAAAPVVHEPSAAPTTAAPIPTPTR